MLNSLNLGNEIYQTMYFIKFSIINLSVKNLKSAFFANRRPCS